MEKNENNAGSDPGLVRAAAAAAAAAGGGGGWLEIAEKVHALVALAIERVVAVADVVAVVGVLAFVLAAVREHTTKIP